ncbi:MAG: response regulator [Chitinivibrionales bacterium]|nr:response regulator [Chitinivibrionales bacterium]
MAQKSKGSVLIVDDEAIIREMLCIELQQQYQVYTAENAQQAFSILDEQPIDLVISDINMPGMKGFELLQDIRQKYQKTKTALITAYDVNDYIRMAKEYDISNIISKSTPFNFDEFNSIVKNLVMERIFGLENYMLPDFKALGEYTILSSKQISEVEDSIIEIISRFHKPEPFVHILLEELITNAVYHAPVDENGREKYAKHSQVVLDETEAVKIFIGRDSEKYGVSVMDTSGKLTKRHALYKIDRHINGEGLLDEDGRGLHMSRIYSDRFIINIKKNTATEAIFMNYLSHKYKGSKPLYINEI